MIVTRQFWMPTKPYTLIDALNRAAAATGSFRYAMATDGADYNGHHITMCWNDYRRYWVAEHFWGGRVVHARGEFADVLATAVKEWNLQGKGATLVVTVQDIGSGPETTSGVFAKACLAAGLVEKTAESEKAHLASWSDWRFGEVHTAIRFERQLGIPVANLLDADPKSNGPDYWKAQIEARRVPSG